MSAHDQPDTYHVYIMQVGCWWHAEVSHGMLSSHGAKLTRRAAHRWARKRVAQWRKEEAQRAAREEFEL